MSPVGRLFNKMTANIPENTDLQLGTSISGWGRAVLLALISLGIDGRRIFLDCGLNPDDQGKPYVRNPVQKMQHVWRIAENTVDDSALLAERIVRYLNASSFHALGFALYASSSVADLFTRICVYREVFSSSVNLFTYTTKREFIFAVEDLRPVKSHITADVLVLFLLKICRELAGPEFSPTAVEVPWDRTYYPESFQKLIQAPLFHNSQHYNLHFKREDVETALPGANTQLASYQDKLCRDYLYSLDESKRLSSRVKLKIIQTLTSQKFSIDYVALSLNMSVRTLQRKLHAEGTSFSELLEQARKELALEYLRNSRANATQMAYMLGFADLPGFSSRFKSWFGQTFTEYRRANQNSRTETTV